jgi:hypothetical protein
MSSIITIAVRRIGGKDISQEWICSRRRSSRFTLANVTIATCISFNNSRRTATVSSATWLLRMDYGIEDDAA